VFPHELQATVIATMFNKIVIQRPDYADGAEILITIILSILLIFFAIFKRT
jgi:hypothetical protein